jgi:predicted alpha/beta-hydrolase family hydrolase
LSHVTEFEARIDKHSAVTALRYQPSPPRHGSTLILAHGAGAGQRSPFMTSYAAAIAALGVDVVTFNFPYVERGRRVPDRRPVLEACFRAVITAVARRDGSEPPFIGGKSMGGRIATHVAAADPALPLCGLVLLGYPLHPPGRGSERRDSHLPGVGRPMLFVQGTRDGFGTPAELGPVLARLRPPATLHAVAGGDHSFRSPKAGAAIQAAIDDDIQRTIVEWIQDVREKAPGGARR